MCGILHSAINICIDLSVTAVQPHSCTWGYSSVAVPVCRRNKLQEVMRQFSSLRMAINDEYRETVRNRIFTVSGQGCADEDVDRIIDTGGQLCAGSAI